MYRSSLRKSYLLISPCSTSKPAFRSVAMIKPRLANYSLSRGARTALRLRRCFGQAALFHCVILCRRLRVLGPNAIVSVAMELFGKFRTAGLDDPTTEHD